MSRALPALVVAAIVTLALGTPVTATAREAVTVVAPWDKASPFAAELSAFGAAKGIDIVYQPYGNSFNFEAVVNREDPPDVIVADTRLLLGASKKLIDLSTFVPRSKLQESFGRYLLGLATADSGRIVGAPISVALKTLVWYRPDEFQAHGYAIPASWADLVALSDRMVRDGVTPWCNYMGAGGTTGWLGTDWVEDLLLGSAGPRVYDGWVDHSVPFVDARIRDAVEKYAQMIDTPGYVYHRESMIATSFLDNVEPLSDGACLMHKQATFFMNWPQDPSALSTFRFPSVDPLLNNVEMGTVDYAAALTSRPGTSKLMQFMLGNSFGQAALAPSGWLLPNTHFDRAFYKNDLVRSWAQSVRSAILADRFRFDASDLMPGSVGSATFWKGMVDLVNGTHTIFEILVAIDASWPATLTNAWQASIGSAGVNGTAKIQLFDTGAGSLALKLAKLKPSATLPATINKGTCGSTTVLLKLASLKTSSKGAVSRTSTLSASQIRLIKKATAGTGRISIRVGTSATGGVKCGTFTALPVPAYVGATISIASGADGPSIDANAAGVFVLSMSKGTVSRVDQATNSLSTFLLEINGNEGPDSIASGEGALWVTIYHPNGPGAVERLDPTTGKVLARISAGSGCSIVTTPGAVWAANERDGSVVRIDPRTNQVVATIPTVEGACSIGAGFGSVWTTSSDAKAIVRLDPITNKVVATIPANLADASYSALVFGLGSAWATAVDGAVLRVDPLTNQVVATIPTRSNPEALAVGAGSVWLSSWGTIGQPDGVLSRIDPATNTVIATIPVGINPGDIIFAGGYVWVGLQGEPTLVKVDPAANAVRARISVGGPTAALVGTDHAVWVAVPTPDRGPGAAPSATLVRVNF